MAQAAETAEIDSQKLHSNSYDDRCHLLWATTGRRPQYNNISRGQLLQHRRVTVVLCATVTHSVTGVVVNTNQQGATSNIMIAITVKSKGHFEAVCCKKQADIAQSTEQAHWVEVALEE